MDIKNNSNGIIAIEGGYLDIRIDGETICTVPVPIPNLYAEKHYDSVVDWYEEFYDNDGNIYQANVYSSMYGVDWDIQIIPKENGALLENEILHDLSTRITIELILTQRE
jgi:hypothetical protein